MSLKEFWQGLKDGDADVTIICGLVIFNVGLIVGLAIHSINIMFK